MGKMISAAVISFFLFSGVSFAGALGSAIESSESAARAAQRSFQRSQEERTGPGNDLIEWATGEKEDDASTSDDISSQDTGAGTSGRAQEENY